MSSFSVEVDSAELRARLQRMIANSSNLQPGLLRAGVAVLKAAQERIDAGGPGWPALWKGDGGHSMLHVTGRLLASLTLGGPDSELDSGPTKITVGTNVKVDGGNYNLGALMQYGTGIYAGHDRIRPKTAKVLAWNNAGVWHRFSSVAGSPARKFLFVDEPLKETITKILAAHVMANEA